ncbi:SPOR domain-containing protein [Pseudoruegeria sp. SHC-113]|uniref:SPOR domain-containing protein n=1 Tax=Pseudoruegeria sp. SHC-113 TaxID=2855439 RepID=UPI0021BA42B7|nr:SPOR domain-containing protein [Pseudoruegeria sp. SHC-113]MCT8161539.1 SPOR domain-containing protein [Pseudoruegeria sp. SHC-113]
MFVRAGVGDAVTWVPRVSRDRRMVCGAKPTFAATQTAPLPVIKDPPASTTSTATAAPTPKPAPTPAPKPAAPAVATAPAKVAPQPAPKSATTTTRKASEECPGASVLSRQYIGDGSRYEVRCGPQKDHPGSYGVGPRVAPASPVSPQSRVIRPAAPQLPEGYKPAWEDDRLNPYRSRRTAQGEAQMRLVWTDTVPRRLVEVEAGQDLELKQAQIKFRKENPQFARAKAPKPSAVAKSSPAAQPAKARWVQVGAYRDPGNAKASAKRLQQLGLPVRYGKYNSKGSEIKLVLAGPFSSQQELSRAMQKARAAGFKDAVYRK